MAVQSFGAPTALPSLGSHWNGTDSRPPAPADELPPFPAAPPLLDPALTFAAPDLELRIEYPWFFHRFLSTTPRFQALASKLADGFHDTARALDVLERMGRLPRVERKHASHSGRL